MRRRRYKLRLRNKSFASSSSSETTLHPDVRGASGRRGLLRLSDPGSDSCLSSLSDVRGLMPKCSICNSVCVCACVCESESERVSVRACFSFPKDKKNLAQTSLVQRPRVSPVYDLIIR